MKLRDDIKSTTVRLGPKINKRLDTYMAKLPARPTKAYIVRLAIAKFLDEKEKK